MKYSLIVGNKLMKGQFTKDIFYICNFNYSIVGNRLNRYDL